MKLPKKLSGFKNLSSKGSDKIKIIWSQQLEDQELKQQREEAEKQERLAEDKRITNILSGVHSSFDDIQKMSTPPEMLKTSKEKL